MKLRFIPILLTCASASLVHAQFNPLALTPSSYTFRVVVPANTVQDVPDTLDVTAGNGTGLGDYTYFEQGLYSRPGTVGGNIGIPVHNTVFTNVNNANMPFLMPPDYTVANEVFIDSSFTSGGFTFVTPTAATQLAILCCGGGGALTVSYTVTHADAGTETGTLSLLDWFAGGSTVAWGANGRITDGGGYANINTSVANNNAPYLYANIINITDTTPITGISFSSPSGNHGNFYAVSASSNGTTYTPVPVTGFNVRGVVPAAIPFPVTATMDQGTNTLGRGNVGMNTWYEQGYDRNAPATGLPPSQSSFTSLTQPSHTYQMGNYSNNSSILIDTNHQVSNLTLSNSAVYTAISFLTAGGNIGNGNTMTNICVIQHQDGVNETNLFFGYDWYDSTHPGALAYIASGRVDMNNRTLNTVGDANNPRLLESYFTLQDVNSAVTNIIVQYKTAPSSTATTFIMAVSASTAPVPPIVTSGPIPASQTVWPGANISFAVGVSGSQPITGYWQVENNGSWFTLSDGLDANGSIISGSRTYTLAITNVFIADGTNYQFVANNSAGTGTSPIGTLIVSKQAISITPAIPVFYQSNNIPLTVNLSAGPAVSLQWYFIDSLGNTNLIAGATNITYTIPNAPLSLNGVTYGVIASNIYGTNTASVVLSVTSSAAFLGADLSPLNAEVYAGAPVVYSVNPLVNARGDSPIFYQWVVNGSVVSGANSNSYSLAAPCGSTTIQVMFTNLLSGGTWISSSIATLQGDPSPTNITFINNGAGWQTNNGTNVALGFNTNVLTLTDGNGNEASSAFYSTAQYVGGSWTASFTYNSFGGAADGTVFVIQNTNQFALGGGGGQMGYGGIAQSIGFMLNLYPNNGETIGIGVATNGPTHFPLGTYCLPSGSVNVAGTNAINVVLTFSQGVLTASLTDAVTGANYTTNYVFGSLVPILGGNVAYVGFTGGDGGATSTQQISNFQFHSVLPAVPLSSSVLTGHTFVLSWSAADPSYTLQMSSSLSSPSWTTGPTPTVISGTNQVTVNAASGGGQQFYRLIRVACP